MSPLPQSSRSTKKSESVSPAAVPALRQSNVGNAEALKAVLDSFEKT
jgi:hypothetical protein